MKEDLKAILFDSGRVLNKPVTGHWFITPNFFEYVDKKKFDSISKIKVYEAFEKAGKYISGQNLIENENEEYKHFLEYYRILFKSLQELEVNEERIECVARDLVFNYDKYEFFEDVHRTIDSLSGQYKLAVVSDAWPSLENVFKKAGLRNYFSSFIISSQIGVSKPNELMYQKALRELKVAPEEAIFIDDSLKNCEGAKCLGIKTILLSRDLKAYIYNKATYKNHRVIKNFYQLNL